MKQIELADKTRIPQLGLGTWQLEGDDCISAVHSAIEIGYRHIDTAFLYNNHREVAAGIARSGIARSELYITTKLPMGKAQKPAKVLDFGQRMLDELQTDYVNLLLIHWPDRRTPFGETLSAMHELQQKGWVRSLGISNFNSKIAVQAAAASPAPLVTNQVEFHPYLKQWGLQETCQEQKMVLTAYSPLARGRVLEDERLQKIARQLKCSIPQLVLAWLFSKGLVAVPKASGLAHLQDNFSAISIELEPKMIDQIDAISEYERLIDGDFKHFPFDEQLSE